jgi:hypothetical protein
LYQHLVLPYLIVHASSSERSVNHVITYIEQIIWPAT